MYRRVVRGLREVRDVSVESERSPGGRDLKRFIDLPFRLHANHPLWVPPLKLERRLFLNRRMNAFFSHGEAEYFLARRDGRVVGRITAQINHAFNDYHETTLGLVRLPRVRGRPGGRCARCSTPPQAWLRARGCERMVGPADFSMNDESGVLIEGFELRPMIRQPWHPPYYQRLMEEAGMTKAMDLLMWNLEVDRARQGAAGDLGARREGAERARHPRAPDAPPPAAQRHGRLRRGLQLGVVEELGLRAVLQEGPRRATPRSCSWSSTSTGS